MKSRRAVCIMLLGLVMINAGCAGLEGTMPRFLVFSTEEHYLGSAVDQLLRGNEQQARDLLEKVVNGVPSSGITDEALFRLALLNLKESGDKGLQRAQSLLERLAEKYPGSLWTRQSAPLLSHLAEVKALRIRQRELKTLKELNLSLSRDNKEMRQSLEQLKQLDLELEKRIKR